MLFRSNKAVELGFADEVIKRSGDTEDVEAPTVSMLYSKANVVNSLMDKIAAKCAIEPKPTHQHRADDLWIGSILSKTGGNLL